MGITLGLAIGSPAAAQEHDPGHRHEPGHHGAHHAGHGAAPGTGLAQAGNGAFAAVQEVVARLEADPDTDWAAVDLEALRRHLVDMDRMTLGVDVVDAAAIEGGAAFRVRPLDDRAAAALRRVLSAHPGALAAERGWRMESEEEGDAFVIRVTGPDPEDAGRIRALGYIGVLAVGAHHAEHHWRIATGRHPHGH